MSEDKVIFCKKCNSEFGVRKFGFTPNKNQRYRCKNPDCKHVFSINENTNRLTEKEKAYIKHNVSESVSLRTIARNLKRSLYTVQYFLKK